MKHLARTLCIVSALVLLQSSGARAAHEDLVTMTESVEAQCRSLRSSEGRVSGGGFTSGRTVHGRDGLVYEEPPVMRSVRPEPANPTGRETRRRVCAEAEAMREALEWEQRPTTATEAVWNAVFVPESSIAKPPGNALGTVGARDESSKLLERYKDSTRRVLRGHPPSEREAFSELAVGAVAEYRAVRGTLMMDRICSRRESTETGAQLAAAVNEVDAILGPLKGQLVDEVWRAVDPAMVAKLTAYAVETQPTVWEANPAFLSDSTPEQVQAFIRTLCLSGFAR